MMFIILKTRPLGFEVTVPTGENTALQTFVPLTVTAAQGLVAALVAQPEVAGALTPEFVAGLDAAVVERTAEVRADAEFLRAAGVRCDA